MSDIKAIIFDCFGVLVQSSYELFKTKYFENDQSKILEFQKIDQASSRGKISQNKANEKFAELAGIDLNRANLELSSNPPNVDLLDFIRVSLKPKYKIAMLSNVAENRLSDLVPIELVQMFDDIVLSCDVGLAKPDVQIFNLSISRLGIRPEQAIFIDDIDAYCKVAESIGINTIKYTDFLSFKKQLTKIIEG